MEMYDEPSVDEGDVLKSFKTRQDRKQTDKEGIDPSDSE